ncbi:MAG: S8 family serine peptidase [Pseudomonadales bacterium]|jgi:subtilisin family serine protease
MSAGRLGRLLLTGLVVCWAGTAAAAPNDPYLHSAGSWQQDFDDQWALENLRVYTDAAGTATASAERPSTVVAVIDTGLDYTHEDFAAARLWRNPREVRNGYDDDDNGFPDDLIGWNFVDANNNPWDLSGHGTHIAGIIAACTDNGLGIAGVDGDAIIMPLKVANFTGQAKSSSVAAAIRYAVDQGARVINLSLGSELVTQLERDAAAYAAERRVLIVTSAGNHGLSTEDTGYASLPGVLVVGASGLDGERAGFSNFGTRLDVLAPGVDVLSLRARDTDFIGLSRPPDYDEGAAFVGSNDAYYRASGTSFSAALVSGMAARLLAERPELDAESVRRVIVQSAVDVGADGVDQISGYGRVDYVRALAAAPGDFIRARLAGVALSLADEKVWIAVQGDADARTFSGAELMVRAAPGSVAVPDDDKRKKKKKKGEPELPGPYDWQPFGGGIAAPVEADTLGTVDLETLTAMTGGATAWELKLVVRDQNGQARESQMGMALPVPEPAPSEEVGE